MSTVVLVSGADDARVVLPRLAVGGPGGPGGPGGLVVLAVTCAPVVELAPRLSDDDGLRGAVDAVAATVVELRDLLGGQHPLAWTSADLAQDGAAVRAALGEVDALVVPPPSAQASSAGDVLRELYPRVPVRTWGPDGALVAAAAPVGPAAAPGPPAWRRRAARVRRAARTRLWEVGVVLRAWADLRRRPVPPTRAGGSTYAGPRRHNGAGPEEGSW